MDEKEIIFRIILAAWSLLCYSVGMWLGGRSGRKKVARYHDKLLDWRARGYFHPYKRVEITLEDIDAFLREK